MQKMRPEYAQKILDGGYSFGNRFFSCHENLLVAFYSEDDWPYEKYFVGTELKNGQLQTDEEGYVIFRRVKPVINESTRFTLP